MKSNTEETTNSEVKPCTYELCKICGGPSRYFDTATVLDRYQVTYSRCDNCGLVETEKPYWLAESYSEAIARSDLGLASRNVDLARKTRLLLSLLFGNAKKFVDYGGGYGLFVRLMRDRGFDFYRFDTYCPNIFAKGFEVGSDAVGFDLLTAFEVFEHLSDPVGELTTMLSMAPTIVLTTDLIPRLNPPKPHEWWYYATDSGQHVTLYTQEALCHLAKRCNLHLYSARNFHVLSRKPIRKWLFSLAFNFNCAGFIRPFIAGRPSLLPTDFQALTGKSLH